MDKKHKYWSAGAITLTFLITASWYLHSRYIAILQPRGTIARQERDLLIVAFLLTVLVVVPVYGLTIMIAWKYRANNRKARYMPDWDGNRALELSWWAIPGVIILVLSIITWHSAHALDPFRPIESKVPPINIQVVSLDWKWLFIYPQQGIASLNFLQIPTNAPINFELTSDSVMNSFWLPALGGQIYTMPGMNTQLHLMATEAGSYRGSSANLSGRGFAGMDFTAQAGSEAQFEQWVKQAQRSAVSLSMPAYNQLAKPSRNNPPAQYSNVQPDLYNAIVAKYMGPVLAPDSADVASGMSHG